MKKEKKPKEVKKHKRMDAGQIFVRVMAGILAIFMVAGTAATVIYAVIGR